MTSRATFTRRRLVTCPESGNLRADFSTFQTRQRIIYEDETGTANAVVVPDLFQRDRAVIHTATLLLIEGPLQKVHDVIHVRARRIRALKLPQHAICESAGRRTFPG